MEISQNDQEFSTSFNNYKDSFDQLKELAEDGLPKTLRLFDIRLRLALSLQIGFDNTISYTRTETTRKTYNLIIRLVDLWFAYEGLYRLCSENSYLKSSGTKADPFTVEKIRELQLDEKVTRFGNHLMDTIYNKTQRKADFITYLQYLIESSLGATQKRLLSSFRSKSIRDKTPDFNEILSLIYGMRNMYVHNADTAKSGVKYYSTKILALKNCNDFLTLISLRVSINIINREINEYQQ